MMRILFDHAVTGATVTLVSARGARFGIYDLAVSCLAPVPLPRRCSSAASRRDVPPPEHLDLRHSEGDARPPEMMH